MKKFDKVFIYFDTNALEDYIPRIVTSKGAQKSYICLSDFKFPLYYYNIENFIKDNGLNEKVEILIPEIVWMELKKHMIEQYEQDKASLVEYLIEYKKIFADLIDVEHKFKEEDYSQYISSLMDDFLSNPRLLAKVIPCPKDDKCISKIIQNAMYTKPPFSKAHKNQKEYSDAGFKDALITETVFANRNDNILTVFVSKDSDFKEVFENVANIIVCDNEKQKDRIDKIVEVLSKQFLIKEEVIKKEISQNEYMLQELIAQTDLDTNLDYKFDHFESISEQNDEETEEPLNVWDVVFMMYVGDNLYKFNVVYDGNARGLESGEIINE